MTDETTTTDSAGITRTADGQIQDGQTPQETSSTTTTEETSAGKTLLTEQGKKSESGEKKTETETKSEVPEKYSDYKVPEGYTLDPEIKSEADGIFKELGLSQDQAQRLVDFYTSKTTEAFKAPFEAYQAMTDEWRTEAENHPDLRGKLGAGEQVNVRIAKALDSLNDPKLVSDFKKLMDLTGAGNHQAFIRVIDKFAQKLTEGTPVAGNGPAKEGQSQSGRTVPTSAAAAIWPSLKSGQ